MLLVPLALFLVCSVGEEVLGGMVSMYPKEVNSVFSNPHMGWWYIDNAIPDQIDAGRSLEYIRNGTPWEMVDHVAILSAWGAIEREKGVFDWNLVDQAVEFWAAQGKKIHFRVSTDPMIMPHVGFVIGAPEWLYDLGVPYKLKDGAGWGKESECKYPDYTHPTYLTYLRRFLAEFAGRYKDHPAVEVVQLCGYGAWGEWHSGFDYPSLLERIQALRSIIDEWSQAWANSDVILVLSNSYEWQDDLTPYGISINHRPKPTYEEYVRASAFDYAYYQIENIALNRNGLSRYVHDAYDGRLMLEFFQRTRKPISGEIAGSLTWYQNLNEGYNPKRAIDEALNYHVNYLMTLGWDITAFNNTKNPNVDSALFFYNQEHKGLIPYGLRWMGYRLVLTQAYFPKIVAPGGIFELHHTWENRAVGRLFQKYPLKVYFFDGEDLVFSSTDESFDVTNVTSGNTYEYISEFLLSEDVPEGTYEVYIALVDGEGEPAIELGIEGNDGNNRYSIGVVQVENSVSPTRAETPSRELVGCEDFESGTFAESFFRIVGKNARLESHSPITGKHSLYGCSQGPMGDFFKLDSRMVPLEPNGTYVISFDYRPVLAPSGPTSQPGYYYFVARSRKGQLAGLRGFCKWQDQEGASSVRKTIVITLGPFDDYELVWGATDQGALLLDNIRIEQVNPTDCLHEGFEEGIGEGFVAHEQSSIESHRPIAGAGSLAVERRYDLLPKAVQLGFTEDDYHYLWTDSNVIKLKPNTSYTVSFAFQQRSGRERGNYFYVYAASEAAGRDYDVGFTRWLDLEDGQVQHKTFSFTTHDYPDYRIIWAIHNGGSCIIDEITIIENGSRTKD